MVETALGASLNLGLCISRGNHGLLRDQNVVFIYLACKNGQNIIISNRFYMSNKLRKKEIG